MTKKIFFLSLFMAIYPFIYLFQGLDITDTGFKLSTFQMIVDAPASVSYGAPYWSTSLLGNYIDRLSLGLIGFRVAAVILCVTTGITVYIVLRKVIANHFILILSIFATYAYVTKSVLMVWGYNNLTAFLFVIGGALLYLGIINTIPILVGLSGLTLGISIFVRTPNLLSIALIFAIPFYYLFLQNRLYKKMWFNLIYFIAGWFIGTLGTCILLLRMGQWDLYTQGIQRLFIFLQETESHHSSNLLITLFFRDHFIAFVTASLVLLMFVILLRIRSYLPKTKHEWILIGITALISLAVLPFKELWRWVVPGTLYAVLLIYIFTYRKSHSNLSLLSLIALLILFIVPLGSGNGIRNALYGSWLALPLALSMIYEKGFKGIKYLQLDANQRVFVYRLAVSILLLLSIVTAYQYTYRDATNRLAMYYDIDHPKLRGIYTTQVRAKIISELLDEIPKHVQRHDYLLTYNEIPLIHYLTETKPWLDNPWPMLYAPQEFESLLYQKEKERDELPIIVRATGNTSSREWPSQEREFADIDAENEIRRLMEEYILLREYDIVWFNDYFEILSIKAE